jgi:hypothetical protein
VATVAIGAQPKEWCHAHFRGLESEGEEYESDEPVGPYALPPRIAEIAASEGVAGSDEDQPGGRASRATRPEDADDRRRVR